MYGFGSKKSVLDSFASAQLTDGAVITVNGHAPRLALKQILVAAVESFYDDAHAGSFSSHSRDALMASLQQLMKSRGTPLYFVVHNIDAPVLRGNDARAVLQQLACIPRVHFVASVDHLNAALLFDKRSSVAFNWLWRQLHTFAPYVDETCVSTGGNGGGVGAFLSLGRSRDAEAVKGAGVVMRSLTPNARAIFSLIAKEHIESATGATGSVGDGGGMTVETLYNMARERFLCSSEDTLRAHIREFRDHELLRVRRGPNGQDIVSIAMDAEATRQVLRDIDSIDQ